MNRDTISIISIYMTFVVAVACYWWGYHDGALDGAETANTMWEEKMPEITNRIVTRAMRD